MPIASRLRTSKSARALSLTFRHDGDKSHDTGLAVRQVKADCAKSNAVFPQQERYIALVMFIRMLVIVTIEAAQFEQDAPPDRMISQPILGLFYG